MRQPFKASVARLLAAVLALSSVACGRSAIVDSALPLKRVVIYRNGVGYFERGGLVDEPEVRFKMRESEVGDFLFVPPDVPHVAVNLSSTEAARAIVSRNDPAGLDKVRAYQIPERGPQDQS